MVISFIPDEIIVSRTKSIYSITARRQNGAAIWLAVFYLLGIVLEIYSVHFIQYTDCWRYLLPTKWVATLFGGNASQSQVRIADVFTTRVSVYIRPGPTQHFILFTVLYESLFMFYENVIR